MIHTLLKTGLLVSGKRDYSFIGSQSKSASKTETVRGGISIIYQLVIRNRKAICVHTSYRLSSMIVETLYIIVFRS